MNTFVIVVGFIASILTIIDLSFKYNNYLGFISKPFLSVNILEVIIFFLIILIINILYLRYKGNWIIIKRSEKFYKNWEDFKNILVKYKDNKDITLQNKYSKLRKKLELDFNFFRPDFIEIEKNIDPKYNGVFSALDNLGHCFSIKDISKWENEVKRTIPKELDCFDGMIIEMKEYFKR